MKPRFTDRPGEVLRPLTRSCFLLLPLGRLFLLFGTCLPSLWSPPFPLHAPALTPPLSRQSAALAHLDSLSANNLVLWTDGSVPFPLAKAALAFLPTALCAQRPRSPFQQAQYVQVFSLKPAPFCTLFASLGSSIKSATSPPI